MFDRKFHFCGQNFLINALYPFRNFFEKWYIFDGKTAVGYLGSLGFRKIRKSRLPYSQESKNVWAVNFEDVSFYFVSNTSFRN